VRHEHAAAGEFERVVRREVGVMIAGEKRGCGGGGEFLHFGTARVGMFRTGTGAGVERVAVEHEPCDALEQGAQLGEPVDAAGTVAVVDVGKNADEFGGHGCSAREARGWGGANAKMPRKQMPCHSSRRVESTMVSVAGVPPDSRSA